MEPKRLNLGLETHTAGNGSFERNDVAEISCVATSELALFGAESTVEFVTEPVCILSKLKEISFVFTTL